MTTEAFNGIDGEPAGGDSARADDGEVPTSWVIATPPGEELDGLEEVWGGPPYDQDTPPPNGQCHGCHGVRHGPNHPENQYPLT